MLLCDVASIRDVVLFPTLRPKLAGPGSSRTGRTRPERPGSRRLGRAGSVRPERPGSGRLERAGSVRPERPGSGKHGARPMRVLVSGMGGELGTRVAADLAAAPWVTDVLGIDTDPPRAQIGDADFRMVDPLDVEGQADVIRSFEPTAIVHLGVFEPERPLRGRRIAAEQAVVAGGPRLGCGARNRRPDRRPIGDRGVRQSARCAVHARRVGASVADHRMGERPPADRGDRRPRGGRSQAHRSHGCGLRPSWARTSRAPSAGTSACRSSRSAPCRTRRSPCSTRATPPPPSCERCRRPSTAH